MPEADFTRQLRRQLLIRECPPRHLRRMVREVADHHEDLKQAALAEGLSESEAESRADTQLGDPLALAEKLITVLRRSSWWGRHTITGFCLLPLLTIPILWAALLLFNLWAAFMLSYGGDSRKLHVAVSNPAIFHHLTLFMRGTDLIGMGLATLLFCWLARRAGVRFFWLALACGICSLEGLFFRAQATPHNFSLGLMLFNFRHGWTPYIPELARAVIPLLIAGAIHVFQRQTLRHVRQPMATP